MRKILVAAFLILGAVTGRAQQSDPRHPNFSGTWILVPPSADPQMAALFAPLGAESVITQDNTAITWGQRGHPVRVRLDLPETRYTTTNNAGTWFHVAQPRWITAALLVTTSTKKDGFAGSYEDALVLSFADDDTLAVASVSTPKQSLGQQPKMITRQWVYRRK